MHWYFRRDHERLERDTCSKAFEENNIRGLLSQLLKPPHPRPPHPHFPSIIIWFQFYFNFWFFFKYFLENLPTPFILSVFLYCTVYNPYMHLQFESWNADKDYTQSLASFQNWDFLISTREKKKKLGRRKRSFFLSLKISDPLLVSLPFRSLLSFLRISS